MSCHWWLCLTVSAIVAGAFTFAGEPSTQPIVPTGVIRLFNGKDLSGWTTWLKATGREDPKKVYTVQDGVIRVSGEGLGYLATDKPYKNYHLIVEYKWGEKHDDSGNVRNAGILLHGIGPDGGANGTWMTCLECQLAQGCEGDLIVIRGKDENGKIIPATITCETEIASDGKTRWKAGGKKVVYSGRQFWWSKHRAGLQGKTRYARQGRCGQPGGAVDARRVHLQRRSRDDQDQRRHRQRMLRYVPTCGEDPAAVRRRRDILPRAGTASVVIFDL